ncbi:hypothetical protein D3C71_1566200 [compost metagenome]
MAWVGHFVARLQEGPLPWRCQIASREAFERVAVFDGVCDLVILFIVGCGQCALSPKRSERDHRKGCEGRGGVGSVAGVACAQVWRCQVISPLWCLRRGQSIRLSVSARASSVR